LLQFLDPSDKVKMARDGSLTDQFKIALDSLQKSSAHTRGVIYLFIIINVSIFLSTFYTTPISYPVLQLTDFRELTRKAGEITRCKKQILPNEKLASTEECRILLQKLNTYESRGIFLTLDHCRPGSEIAGVDSDCEFGEGLRSDMVKWTAKLYVDRLFESRKYKIPIIGIDIDIDYVWILSSFAGAFTLLVIRSAISCELNNLKLIINECCDSKFEQRIVLNARTFVPYAKRSGPLSKRLYLISQRSIIFVILTTPVLSQLFIILYTAIAIPTFLSVSPSFVAVPIIALIISFGALLAMLVMAWGAYILGEELASCYRELRLKLE